MKLPPTALCLLFGMLNLSCLPLNALAAESLISPDCETCRAANTVDFLWSDKSNDPQRWRVLAAPATAQRPAEWFDLLAGDARTLSRHLHVDGQLSGGPLINAGLLLRHTFTDTGIPYRQHLTISLQNAMSDRYQPEPGDELHLTLGPGLGQEQVARSGFANALYSYIEAVALVDTKVLRFRPATIAASELSWAAENPHWFGLHGRYFALLLAPQDGMAASSQQPVSRSFLVSSDGNGVQRVVLEWGLPLGSLNPGESLTWSFDVYSGPKSIAALQAGQQGYDRILLPGLWAWLRWLSLGLMALLTAIHALLPNWGLAVLVLALVVRLLMYPVAKKAMHQQLKFIEIQKRIAPEFARIKLEYRGEEQSEKILGLYEQHGTSPLTGLKPLLIVLLQLPILIALFHGLGGVYELRDASFLWIDTLAEPDHLFAFGFSVPVLGEYFNLLPVLMAATTLATIKLSPAPASDEKEDKQQSWFLILMALLFFLLFYSFPSGMVLYWTAANALHVGQHRLVKILR